MQRVVQDYGAVEDEDVDMMDFEYKYEALNHVDQIYPAPSDREVRTKIGMKILTEGLRELMVVA